MIERSLVSVRLSCLLMFVNNLGTNSAAISFRVYPACLFDEIVMEMMWVLKKMKLRNDNLFPMNKGLKMILNRHGFDVKPEMVSSQVAFLNVDIKCFELCALASLSFSVTH